MNERLILYSIPKALSNIKASMNSDNGVTFETLASELFLLWLIYINNSNNLYLHSFHVRESYKYRVLAGKNNHKGERSKG